MVKMVLLALRNLGEWWVALCDVIGSSWYCVHSGRIHLVWLKGPGCECCKSVHCLETIITKLWLYLSI